MSDGDLIKLPPALKAIRSALGVKRTQEFLAKFGGQVVWLTKGKQGRFQLSETELVKLRRALKEHLIDNSRIELPKNDKILIATRNTEIRKLKQQYSFNELSEMYNLTNRQIRNICALP